MFKLVVLFALVALGVAKPSGVLAPAAVAYTAPAVAIAEPAVISSVPTSISSQSSTVVHGRSAVVAPLAPVVAPAIARLAPVAPVVAAPFQPAFITPYSTHEFFDPGFIPAPIAYTAW